MTKYLTTEEAARFLGLTKRGIDQLCLSGRLTYYKPSKYRMFKVEDLEAFVEGGKVKAVA